MSEEILNADGSLLARTVVKGDTTFRIEKMPAMKGYRCFENIRAGLTRLEYTPGLVSEILLGAVPAAEDALPADEDAGNAGAEQMVQLVDAILQLDESFIERVRTDLFAFVKFQNAGAQYRVLLGNEDQAFRDPLDVYDLLVRAFSINFTDSFRGLFSRIGGVLGS